MRNLVILLLLFGFVIGLAPLGWYQIGEMTTNTSGVVYSGGYEPLNGVTTSDEFVDAMNKSFDRRTQGLSTLWLYLVPIASATLGALTGLVLGRFGFMLNRNRTRDA
ncbi:hypothetical protein CH254_13550 [Rhodococcus sp. 06-412-2C]|uniref:hypothetical protein n=1 Tax=unclassified Rhodococcus (in: high G+C Gram-positive bacteria) TaxID=192944 RepID=UPI000B9AAE86|nr:MULTISPECIES: hypothetical protein [unclassified Rhodococcus (in: high G+C Gram-positive bacteria)]OZC88859.1 hypothetical protein CH254_13550 [Rhodococcus sp. 06-412-2C]OZD03224.1 hypothetical protein CH279_03080 [Rhodococcus sp. 06-412-2B]